MNYEQAIIFAKSCDAILVSANDDGRWVVYRKYYDGKPLTLSEYWDKVHQGCTGIFEESVVTDFEVDFS